MKSTCWDFIITFRNNSSPSNFKMNTNMSQADWTDIKLKEAIVHNRTMLKVFEDFKRESSMLLEDIEATHEEDNKEILYGKVEQKCTRFRCMEFLLLLKEHESLLLKMQHQYHLFLDQLYKKNTFEDICRSTEKDDDGEEEYAQRMPFSSGESDTEALQ